MNLKKLLLQIKKANTNLYRDPSEVDDYINEPYHVLRAVEGIRLLSQGLDKGFENSKRRVIELASSTGEIASLIKKECCEEVFASDIEFVPLNLARRNNIECIQFNAADVFPFSSEQFNGIYMGELIEHLLDTSFLISECNRILKLNGILVITTPNLAGLQDRIGFLFGKSPRHINPLHEYLSLHIRPFTFEMLKQVLVLHGFKVITVRSNYVRIRFSSGQRINSRLLAKIFPTLGGSLVVAAKKITSL